ncbi:MAG: DUF192 domain-containing protein [Nanoarchaeota archaeon]|nr:DUF192 domain-containing protein [Nanoarchaeota archaeon]MBU4308671.1 DUF192 domain-containing protein [Nanoarchaeota archaeon]
MKIKKGSKEIEIKVEKCRFFRKAFGLMFTRREKAKALLFEFSKQVDFHLTSLFVFFPFVCVWLNEKNEVLDLKIVKPFKFSVPYSKNYFKIVEIPISSHYKEIIQNIVGEEKFKKK